MQGHSNSINRAGICLSVCPSVSHNFTSRCSVKRLNITVPTLMNGSPGICVLGVKELDEIAVESADAKYTGAGSLRSATNSLACLENCT